MLIYLFPDVNIKLRAKFLKEMKPGSRLVSHAFDMGDWKPDNSASIRAQRVYYWVIPANATGSWTWSSPGDRRTPVVLEMEQKYQAIRGAISAGGRKMTLLNAKLSGSQLVFTIEEDVGWPQETQDFAGTISGNVIIGTIETTDGKRVQKTRWKAVRNPSTVRPIESGYSHSDLLWY